MKIIKICALALALSGCGGSSSDAPTETPTNITPPPIIDSPTSLKPRPIINFNSALLEDIEQFVKLTHSVQYFYPSEAVRDTEWPLFIAHSILELSQINEQNRLTKGLEILQTIAPYISTDENDIPQITSQTDVLTWIQDSPLDQNAYTRKLRTNTFNSFINDHSAPSNRQTALSYGQETIYLPLYLPTQSQSQGAIFKSPNLWTVDTNFNEPEVCMAIVSSMWAKIQHFWPYFSQISVAWPQSLAKLLTACTHDDFEQRQTLIYTEFTKLKDNHIHIALPTPEHLRIEYYVPFLYELVENKPIVVRTEQGQQTGIQIGDEITSIDGIETDTYLTQLSLFSLRNDLHRKKHPAMMQVYKNNNTPILYGIRKPDGSQTEIEVTPKALSNSPSFEGLRYVPRSSETVEKLTNGIYRINVYNVKESELDEVKTKIKDAKAVVLDLRRYPTSWFGWQGVLSWFINQDATINTLTQFWQGAPNQIDAKAHKISQTIRRSTQPLSIPSIVLSARTSQSQNEHSLTFARSGGLVILGEPTSGINGEILDVEYFNGVSGDNQGARFIYTNMQANRLNGDPLINAGVEPDIHVVRTIESVRKQQDNQLAAAIEYLTERLDD